MAKRRGPDGSVRVAVSGSINGETWANVFWAVLGGGNSATQAGLDAWTTSFYNAYVTNLAPIIPTGVTIVDAASTLFQNVTQALHSVHAGTGTGGLGEAPILDNAACKVISWNSQVYWRGGKPRSYVPGVGSAETTDGKTLINTAVLNAQNAGTAMHTAINALSAPTITQTTHGFCSFMSGGVALEPGVFYPILGAAVHKRIGTQRSRLGPWVA